MCRLVGGADADVVEAAAVAEGDGAALVDAVVADAVADGCRCLVRRGWPWSGRRRPRRGCAGRGPGGAGRVVVGGEAVELGLELAHGGGWVLLGQVASSGSGGSVRPCRRSGGGRAGSACSRCPRASSSVSMAPAPPRAVGGEDGAVVGEHEGRDSPRSRRLGGRCATTSAAWWSRRHGRRRSSREWSSMMLRISTSVPSARAQWVMSACQHSLGSSAWKRRQELWGACGAGG